MNPLQKATALLEAATAEDLERLCGAERIMLAMACERWARALEAHWMRRGVDALQRLHAEQDEARRVRETIR